MNRKIIIGIVAVGLVVAGIIGWNYYQKIFSGNVSKTEFLFIKSTDKLEDVATSLENLIDDKESFLWVADMKKFSSPKAGKYQLKEGMSNNDLVNLLRSGDQTPVKVSFNNQNTLQELAGRIAVQIEADSTSLVKAFTDKTFLSQQGITELQMLGYFIPNTYELWWNTSAEKFRDRMVKEYKRFWNEDRMKKAKALKMKPNEVIALASIVQKETPKAVEQPRVAGLYLNRIKIGMPLQSDPSVIFALKQIHGQDFQIKRVLLKDLKVKSPYNTYLNSGLPPSLIAMPDITAIDAILNYERHDYLYMCVDVDNLGYHAFASSIQQHNRNARKYHRWLDKQGIRR